MPADQPRTRTVGCKMTDNEYEGLSAVAEGDGMTLGEWVREVLLERADGRKPSVIEETLLAEVLALRTILLNLDFAVAEQEEYTGKNQESAEKVARTGLRALAAGRSYVISGLGNYLGAQSQRIVPRRVVTRIAASMFRPGKKG